MRERLDRTLRASVSIPRLLALLLMDLDRFKDIDDTLGQHYGDLLLQQIGPRMQGDYAPATPWLGWVEMNSPSCSQAPTLPAP